MKHLLEAAYAKYVEDFSGTCLVTCGDAPLFAAVNGEANKDFSILNQLNTRFDTASITKVFTAVAILALVEQGALRLTDRIHDVIDLSNTMIPQDVCIHHLLSHTSGIADDADEEDGEDYAALFIDKPNYAIRDCGDFLPQFAYKAPRFVAGTAVRYNNCAFVLLGLAIERITGIPYRDYATAQVFGKAGMSNSAFCAKDEVCPNLAEGYFASRDQDGNFIKWKKNIYSYPPIGTADGGAVSTVHDLHMFIRSLVTNKILTPDYTKMILLPQCSFTREHRHGTWRMGYAFEMIEHKGSLFCLYKEGSNAGVDAILSYYPTLDITLNILANQEGSMWAMYRALQAVLFAEFEHRNAIA